LRIDLTDPAQRAQAVQQGYIWQSPQGAIVAALKDIAAGRIPPPDYIPTEFADLAAQYGVQAASAGGISDGSGPA
jgi:hypothetical protein